MTFRCRYSTQQLLTITITEETELSFGPFYNYFSSKEEVSRAVFIVDALHMIEALDAFTIPAAGIAERVGINIRRTVYRGLTDPVWGWFLVHSVYSINHMIETMGNPLARDIQVGNDEGAFQVVDIVSTVDCIIGGMLYLLRKVLEGARPPSAVESMVHFVLSGLVWTTRRPSGLSASTWTLTVISLPDRAYPAACQPAGRR